MTPIETWAGWVVCRCAKHHNPTPKSVRGWHVALGDVTDPDAATMETLLEGSDDLGIHWLCPTTADAVTQLCTRYQRAGRALVEAELYGWSLYVRKLAAIWWTSTGNSVDPSESMRVIYSPGNNGQRAGEHPQAPWHLQQVAITPAVTEDHRREERAVVEQPAEAEVDPYERALRGVTVYHDRFE